MKLTVKTQLSIGLVKLTLIVYSLGTMQDLPNDSEQLVTNKEPWLAVNLSVFVTRVNASCH